MKSSTAAAIVVVTVAVAAAAAATVSIIAILQSEYHCNFTKETVQVKLLQWNPLDLNNQVKGTKGYEGLIKRKVNHNNTKITMLLKEARVYGYH